MKKSLGLLSLLLIPVAGIAQELFEPTVVPGAYILHMSPNGKWQGITGGDAGIYNVETGESVYYDEAIFGLGNCLSNNGVGVGDIHDSGVLMFNGQVIRPEALSEYWFSDIHAITPDGSKIVGIVNNTERNGIMRIPFIASVDNSLNVSEVTILPYPEKDFFNAAPQYCTAVWVSDDGKTVVGQVTDNVGWYLYPIVYKQDSAGNWSYSLPSETLFNPEHIDIPQNPYVHEPPYPEPENFMTGNDLTAYQEAYDKYIQGAGSMPNPFDYMNEEEQIAYEEAVNTYNDWFDNAEAQMQAFFRAYDQIMMTTPTFSQNELCIDPNGKFLMMHGGKINEEGDMEGLIFKFGITDDTIQELNPPSSNAYPSLVLPDGTLIAATPKMSIPSSWFLLPGSSEFVTPQEFYQSKAPAVSEWFDKWLPYGTGVISLSDDMSVMTTCVMPDQLGDENYDKLSEEYNFTDEAGYTGSYFYYSFVFQLGEAGVESILATPEDGIFKVYNLKGEKVLETKNASEVDALGHGLYIINGKKIMR